MPPEMDKTVFDLYNGKTLSFLHFNLFLNTKNTFNPLFAPLYNNLAQHPSNHSTLLPSWAKCQLGKWRDPGPGESISIQGGEEGGLPQAANEKRAPPPDYTTIIFAAHSKY